MAVKDTVAQVNGCTSILVHGDSDARLCFALLRGCLEVAVEHVVAQVHSASCCFFYCNAPVIPCDGTATDAAVRNLYCMSIRRWTMADNASGFPPCPQATGPDGEETAAQTGAQLSRAFEAHQRLYALARAGKSAKPPAGGSQAPSAGAGAGAGAGQKRTRGSALPQLFCLPSVWC